VHHDSCSEELVPEGDTVYLTAKRLHAALAGHDLRIGELRHPRWAERDLAGLTVLEVRSVGKHLFTRFDSSLSMHSHLRMDGSWHLYRPGDRWRLPGHDARAVLATDQRTAVGFRLHDLALLPTEDEHELVGHLGPDLLDPDWGEWHQADAVRRLTARSRAELGLALLEQRVVAGIGNLYKTEVCFLLGLSPWTQVRDVPDPARAISLARKLLRRNANRPEQSTTSLPPSGADRGVGELARDRRYWVYRRAGRACHRCGTTIRTGEQGDGVYARTAYYCPSCQPGPVPARPE
jgi:endonuclease VIII